MKHNLSRLRIAVAVGVAALVVSLFPATSYAASANYWPPYPSTYGPAYSCSHMVHYGDTMSSLAARYGTSVGNLMQMNGVYNPNLIYAGTSMRVPCTSPGYGYMYPYPYGGTYSYPRMYPYQNPYSYPGMYSYPRMYSYPGMYSYPNTYSSPCMGSVYGAPCSTAHPYQPYPTQPYPAQPYATPSYPVQPYPMQPYATPAYPAPAPQATPSAPGVVTVVMRNIAFNPSTVMIHVGQTVTWRNDDTAPHTTTSGSCPGGVCTPAAGWDSGTLNPGQSFAHQFTTTGTFPYFCRIHGAMMQGTIVVMP